MNRSGVAAALLALLVGLAAGCDRTGTAPSNPPSRPAPSGADSATAPSGAGAPRRIVSFAPAITTTVARLGAADAVVGRTPWCRAVPPEVAVAWDGASVDAERLIALEPTLVLFQATVGAGPRREIAALAAGRDWTVRSWRLDRLSDVRTMIGELGDALGGDSAAAARALLERFDRVCAPDPNVEALGPTLLLFGTDPPTAFGPGSYVDDIWRSLGGRNAVSSGAYPELTVEEIARLDPAWIVLVGSKRLAERAKRLPVAAIREGRVIEAEDAGLLEPGASVVSAIETLRASVGAARERAGMDAPKAARDDLHDAARDDRLDGARGESRGGTRP